MSTPSPSLGSICIRAMRWRLSAFSSQTMSVSKWLNCCSLVSGTTSARVSQFLLGCSLSKPVRYCRRVSALGPWVKCTRSGDKNSASSGRGARRACGNRARFWVLRLIRLGYRRFTGPDKVVLGKGSRVIGQHVQSPRELLVLYNMESSPYCRKVREALTELDLAYVCKNAPRGSWAREQLLKEGNKVMVPFLIDPNHDVKMYESDQIVEYLYRTY